MFQQNSPTSYASGCTDSLSQQANALNQGGTSLAHFRASIQEVAIVGSHWIDDNYLCGSSHPAKKALCALPSSLANLCDLAEKTFNCLPFKNLNQDTNSPSLAALKAAENEVLESIRALTAAAPNDAAIKDIAAESLKIVQGVMGLIQAPAERKELSQLPAKRPSAPRSLADIYERVRILAIERIQGHFLIANFGSAHERESCGLDPEMLIELAGAVNNALSDDTSSVFTSLLEYGFKAKEFDAKNRNDSGLTHLELCNQLKDLIGSELFRLCRESGQPVPKEITIGGMFFSVPPAVKGSLFSDNAKNKEGSNVLVPEVAVKLLEPAGGLIASNEDHPPLAIGAVDNVSNTALALAKTGSAEPSDISKNFSSSGPRHGIKRWSKVAAALILTSSTFILGRMSVQRTDVGDPARAAHVGKDSSTPNREAKELTRTNEQASDVADSRLIVRDDSDLLNVDQVTYQEAPSNYGSDRELTARYDSGKLNDLQRLGSETAGLLGGMYNKIKTIAGNFLQKLATQPEYLQKDLLVNEAGTERADDFPYHSPMQTDLKIQQSLLQPKELGTYYDRGAGLPLARQVYQPLQREQKDDFFDFGGLGKFSGLVLPFLSELRSYKAPAEVYPVPEQYRLKVRPIEEIARGPGENSFLAPHLLGSENLSVVALQSPRRQNTDDSGYILNPFALGRADSRSGEAMGYPKRSNEDMAMGVKARKEAPARELPAGRLLSVKKD
jgi:hypothetical protein